jgi:hypothetical protein
MPSHVLQGRWRKHQLRMWEDMCAGWLVLHKASLYRCAPGLSLSDCLSLLAFVYKRPYVCALSIL